MERDFLDNEDWLRQTGGDFNYGNVSAPPTTDYPRDILPPTNAGPAGPPVQTNAPPPAAGKTPQQIEEEGRAYDLAHGLIGGYMMNGVWVNGSPHLFGGGGGPAPQGPATGTFSYDGGPTANFGSYQSAGEFVPRNATFNFTPFSYGAFPGSSWEDAEKEPGFDKSQERLRKMVENSAAYRGVLRSGMTIGDVGTYLDQNKSQNFQQFDARNFRNWGANRDNAFSAWNANLNASRNKFLDEYGIDKDIYGFRAQDIDRGNNYNFNTKSAELNNELAKWTAMVNSLTTLGRPV